MNNKELSELIFSDIRKSPSDYEKIYPKRKLPDNAMVTRLGPSPTGFIHLGNLYGAFVDERLAHQSDGVFYLRIEDTDDKRYVDNAVDTIISSLDFFGINFDEGVTAYGENGEYGPYIQSERGEIYRSFAKKLIADGNAYPCFLSENEISDIRTSQEEKKISPGIYMGYSKYRDWDKSPEIEKEIISRIKKGDSFVIRLKSTGTPNAEGENIKRTEIFDEIRGVLNLPENFQDVVIIKATGIPTYHFAHVVDDHLMRTTHVIRGEEWLPSLPIHIELFEKLGFEPPIYCHTAQLMKLDENGNKRKLSKRKDPELSLSFYRDMGYHPEAVREYLLTILNSNYEEWRRDNPDLDSDKFKFTTSKMNTSGALFDLNKLNDVSKDTLLRIPASELAIWLRSWSTDFAPEYSYLFDDIEYLEKILDIGRNDKKPRKDLAYARQIIDFISYFWDNSFKIEDEFPLEIVKNDDVNNILRLYLDTYDHNDDNSAWFDKIRNIATDLGYAGKPKDYKKNPDDFKGHVGHVSTVIRIAIMGRSNSPDIWTIQQILGEDKVKNRLLKAISNSK
ncbi:glutamate--tRNA ligase [Alterileibacterium massiliense]|uniref:glutamate--tRNA ligase n=1 Tax=Alterileibacterium massiliense TaxID=1870997 RepID=UPI0008D95747|nr:glutamate--tRNA ligase family protein [Alterileibacterium massiliense]